MWPYKPKTTVIILAPLIFSFALALDVYMPVLPEMRRMFHTSQSAIQLTISVFFFICGLGQLILGPLSDQYGRLKVVWASAFLFIIGSALCSMSKTIDIFLIFRALEALGAAGLSVSAFAIVRDTYDGKDSALIYSYLNGMLAFSPILGPLIGVALITHYPWYSAFYFLTVLAISTALIILVWGKESLNIANRKAFNWSVFYRYFLIGKSLTFWSFTLPAIAGISSFFALFSMTPYIVEELGLPKTTIMYAFGAAGLSFMIGSFVSGSLTQKLGVFKTTVVGTFLILLSGIILIIVYQLTGLTLVGFFGPCVIATFGCALTSGAGASGALEPFGEFPGAASAMFGALQLGGSSIIGSISSLFVLNSSYPLAFTMIIMSLFSLLIIFFKSRANIKTIS